MTPSLPAAGIARGTGVYAQHREPGPGETRVTCPRSDCAWSTIRPEAAAWSAGEAHRIHHVKGMAR